MKFLLDTHIFLWGLSNVPRLSSQVQQVLLSPVDDVFVSVVSAWEIGIKKSLAKLTAPDDLEQEILRCGFLTLQMTFDHAKAVATLPWQHRDPFDRMLIAQAQIEALTLVTADPIIRKYDVNLLFMVKK